MIPTLQILVRSRLVLIVFALAVLRLQEDEDAPSGAPVPEGGEEPDSNSRAARLAAWVQLQQSNQEQINMQKGPVTSTLLAVAIMEAEIAGVEYQLLQKAREKERVLMETERLTADVREALAKHQKPPSDTNGGGGSSSKLQELLETAEGKVAPGVLSDLSELLVRVRVEEEEQAKQEREARIAAMSLADLVRSSELTFARFEEKLADHRAKIAAEQTQRRTTKSDDKLAAKAAKVAARREAHRACHSVLTVGTRCQVKYAPSGRYYSATICEVIERDERYEYIVDWDEGDPKHRHVLATDVRLSEDSGSKPALSFPTSNGSEGAVASLLACDDGGKNALHHLCQNRLATPSMLLDLTRCAPPALSRKDHAGNTPLIYLLCGDQVESQAASFDPSCKSEEASEAWAEVVKLLLEAHAEGASVADKHGQLPLHWAVAKQAGVEVVKLLLEAHAEGASVADNYGQLPLHRAVEKQAGTEVVKLLLEAHAEGASVAAKNGWLPLHWAVARQAGAEVVKLLLEVHAEGASVANKLGWLPLHFAVAKHLAGAKHVAGAEVLKLLLEAHAEGASVADKDGWLP
eukprot:COSAG05_NODE_1905_length_3849_cov_524.588533_1_plen_576_part_10